MRGLLERHALGSGSWFYAPASAQPRPRTCRRAWGGAGGVCGTTCSASVGAKAPLRPRAAARLAAPALLTTVLAAGGGGARILIGRDLSSGGMRVAPCANLSVGDALKLVIYGPPGALPW